MVLALIVTPDGVMKQQDIEGDLDTLVGFVGGLIEYVFVTNGVHAYVNEEGKIRPGFEPNPQATLLAGLLGVDMLMGTAVFLGDGPAGEEGDLPAEWLALGV